MHQYDQSRLTRLVGHPIRRFREHPANHVFPLHLLSPLNR
jgi:hypothetical protein